MAATIMFLAGAKQVYLPTTENLLRDDPHPSEIRPSVLTNSKQANLVEKNLEFIPIRAIVTSAHMQATDKMGSSPRDSVVSTEFRVWGTNNLYIVDASVFPTCIGANPLQSVYTFAKIFADRMLSAR